MFNLESNVPTPKKLELYITPENSLYGRDYRNKENENKHRIMKSVNGQTDFLAQTVTEQNARIENLVINESGDSNPEVIDARVDSDGTTHPSLRAKLNNDSQKVQENFSEVDERLNNLKIDVTTCGAIPDGKTDVKQAIQTAVAKSKFEVHFPPGVYYLSDTIVINKKISITGNNATIVLGREFDGKETVCVFDFQEKGSKVIGLSIENPYLVKGKLNNICFKFQKGLNKVRQCEFYNLHWLGTNLNAAVAFLVGGEGGNIVEDCYADNCPGLAFTQQSYDKFQNCHANDPYDVSFVTNGPDSVNCIIQNNTVYASGKNKCSGHIAAEQGASHFNFSNNTIRGVVDGYGIGAVHIGSTIWGIGKHGIISNNIIDGLSIPSQNPPSGIVIHSNYYNIKVTNNTISDIGTSAGGIPTLMSIAANNNIVEGNYFKSDNLINYVIIYEGIAGVELKFTNNTFVSPASNASFISFSNFILTGAVSFKDNKFIGGAEGISTANISLTKFANIIIQNNEGKDTKAIYNVTNTFGSFVTERFFITSPFAYNRPHFLSILGHKEMYSNNVTPTSGYWQPGHKIWIINPDQNSEVGYVCTSPGTPGIWRKFGDKGA